MAFFFPSTGSDKAKNPGSVVEVKKEEATEVAVANRQRVSLTLVNDGENTIYVFKGKGAEVGKGIPIPKGTGLVISDYTGVVTAAARTAKTNLCVCEV